MLSDNELYHDELFDDEENAEKALNQLHEHYRFTADPGQGFLRIDKFLANRIENVSRNKIQDAAEAGCILVNSIPVKSNYRVKPNDIIQIMLPDPPREIEIIPENIPLNILFEDDSLIVVDKAAGMVVHPAYGNYTGTLVNALAFHLKNNSAFDKNDFRPGLVHRIDKNTSGILVVAKNEASKVFLARQFFNRTINRRYVALVWGNFDDDAGTITGNIGRNPKNRKVMYVFPDNDNGKPAITHYTVLERFSYVSLVECKLETGRTHQIRVHMKFIKHPIFNDNEYGGDEILKGTTFTKYKQFIKNCFTIMPRQALHAKSLEFEHPVTGERMFFQSEIPKDMQTVIEKWKTYTINRDVEETE